MEPPDKPRDFIHEVTADEASIDANGHLNNVVFVQWMQDVAILHWESRGGGHVLPRNSFKTLTSSRRYSITSCCCRLTQPAKATAINVITFIGGV